MHLASSAGNFEIVYNVLEIWEFYKEETEFHTLTWLGGAGHGCVRDEVVDPLDVPHSQTVAGPVVVAQGEAGQAGQGSEGPDREVPQLVVLQW